MLNTGDVSLDGATHESDLAAARACAMRSACRCALPARQPHDLGDNQDSHAPSEPAIDDVRRARYCAHFCPDFWTLDVAGWRLLGVNAQLLGSDLAAAPAQDATIAAAAASRLG